MGCERCSSGFLQGAESARHGSPRAHDVPAASVSLPQAGRQWRRTQPPVGSDGVPATREEQEQLFGPTVELVDRVDCAQNINCVQIAKLD